MAAYTKRIEIQKLSVISDDIGNQTEEWTTFIKAWCSASVTTAREFVEAAQVNAENDITFKMHFSRKIFALRPSEIRILYGGKQYDVKRITDYREMHRTLEIRAVEINGELS